MTGNKSVYQGQWRYYVVLACLLIGMSGLLWRMVQLTVLDRQFLQQQGKARSLRTIATPASRGMITDRNGRPLAISSPTDSVWLNPKEIDLTDPKLNQLAHLLSTPVDKLVTRIEKRKQREFMYLKRQVEPHLKQQIAGLDLSGVYFQQEYRRFYPEGEVFAHVVGITDIDEHGQEGLELSYDRYLRGEPGKRLVKKDRIGRVVEVLDELTPASPGNDLALSLDQRIQYLAFRELQKAVNTFKAKSGSVVVLDVQTGEVLAMANMPTFNPNRRPKKGSDSFRNRALTDVFEPGSTIKALAMANIFEQTNLDTDSVVHTHPGWMNLNGKLVKDHRNNGDMTVTEILQRSSNVGMAKLTLQTPAPSLWKLLHDVGFGQVTASQFPGEVSGTLTRERLWADFTLATLSFGYGMSSTNLQLAQSYGVLAAKGIKRPVTILKQSRVNAEERVLSEQAAEKVLQMLTAVVEGGTGKRAKVPGYHVLGKTGTVRKVGPQGYDKDHHIGMFVGAAPASNPRVVISVVIDDPLSGDFYGGIVATPVFANVMAGTLRVLDVPPDDIDNGRIG